MKIQSHCKSQAEFPRIFMELMTPNGSRGLKNWWIWKKDRSRDNVSLIDSLSST